MSLGDSHTHDLLKQAREKAEKLLLDLRAKFAEVEANPPQISEVELAQGRTAMLNAIASAERMLKSLDDAQRIASTDLN